MSLADLSMPSGPANLPLFGPLLRALATPAGAILGIVAALVALLVVAVLTWGLPALGLVALASVPVLFVVLIVATMG